MKSTIHFYDVPAKHMILAARAAVSFGKKDCRDIITAFGEDNRPEVAVFSCYRTNAGNISIRFIK